MRGSREAIRFRYRLNNKDTRPRAIREISEHLAVGSVTEAAESLNVTRVTLYRWVKEFPALRKALRDARRSGHPNQGYGALCGQLAHMKARAEHAEELATAYLVQLEHLAKRFRGMADRTDVTSRDIWAALAEVGQ